MQTIYKYPFNRIHDAQEVILPKGAEVLHVGIDPWGNTCLWVKIDVDEKTPVKRTVYVVPTGKEIGFKKAIYVGSFVDGPYVWHVFISP